MQAIMLAIFKTIQQLYFVHLLCEQSDKNVHLSDARFGFIAFIPFTRVGWCVCVCVCVGGGGIKEATF